MSRIIITIALFATPFVLYAGILLATNAGILQPKAWTLWRFVNLILASLALVAAVIAMGVALKLLRFTGAPPGSTYVPAHIEDGKFVPGTTR